MVEPKRASIGYNFPHLTISSWFRNGWTQCPVLGIHVVKKRVVIVISWKHSSGDDNVTLVEKSCTVARYFIWNLKTIRKK